MKKINVCFTPDECEVPIVGISAVIDVLRATSVMTRAIALGASSVIPTVEIESARELKEAIPLALLGGERKGLKIEGFDFGNSPLEISKENVIGKDLIITTSNGTRAIKKVMTAKTILLASFLSLKAVVTFLSSTSEDLTIVCSGTGGKPSFEDTLCAGGIVRGLAREYNVLSDSATIAMDLFNMNVGDLESSIIAKSSHAGYLTSIGYAADIGFCAKMNLYSVFPIWSSDRFVRSVRS